MTRHLSRSQGRETLSEYMNTRMLQDRTIVSLEVSKVGGGTVGESYDGLWEVRIASDAGTLAEYNDLHTGTPKTHEEVIDIALDLYEGQE